MGTVLLVIAWFAVGAWATKVGNDTLHRRYPLAGRDGDEGMYILAFLGPVNWVAMAIAIRPWRG